MENIPYTVTGSESLLIFASKQREELKNYLKKHGAILLRGFKSYSLSEFQKVSEFFCDQLSDYVYRSSPRTKLGDKVYTSTEYPSNLHIPLHNENSYTLNWPRKILFYCVTEPKIGGETPIANSSQVYHLIDPAIREEFERRKVMYVRNYGLGVDLAWEEVFQTQSRADVEAFCQSQGITHEWLGENKLRTKQICQAVISHPLTQETLWFNQAHLFHESANPIEVRNFFKAYADDEIPRNAFFGDGAAIDVKILDHIRAAYKHAEIAFSWRKGDLMILDNLWYAHARRPFEGERKIAVAMGD